MAKYHILVLVHKTKGILAVTMELPIICIWHIASASNLAQRQQWNFPLGVWCFVIVSIIVAVADSNWMKPVQVGFI